MGVDEADLLRERGLRVTAQRLAVLRAVSGDPHATADAVAATVRAEVGTVSLQAVYDALGVLVEADLIRRIEPAHSPARFEPQAGDNHHHAICRECGRIADVDCAPGSAPCLVPVDDKGFEIDEAEVVYWGRCPHCQKHRERRPWKTRAPARPRARTGTEKRRPPSGRTGTGGRTPST